MGESYWAGLDPVNAGIGKGVVGYRVDPVYCLGLGDDGQRGSGLQQRRNGGAHLGVGSVEEEKKTVTMTFTASTFPNWDGVSQTRTIDKLTDDEMINTNPQVGAGRGSAYNLYKRVR